MGHDKRMCPQLEKNPPPAVIIEDVEEGSDDNESVTSSVCDVEWDDDTSVVDFIDKDVPVPDVMVPLMVDISLLKSSVIQMMNGKTAPWLSSHSLLMRETTVSMS